MRDATIVMVSHYAASAVGHGGLHRALQLEHDARALVGDQRFLSVSLERWGEVWRNGTSSQCRQSRGRPLRHIERRLHNVRNRLSLLEQNPFRLIAGGRIPFSTMGWVPTGFIQHYTDLVTAQGGAKVCVIEHPMFGEILELNARLGIPTISAFHNLETLDIARIEWQNRKSLFAVMTDLGNELRLLDRCANRLTISKVEAGFLGGLGMECHYYPYLPVGPIRDDLQVTRTRRLGGEIEPGLIVLLGSAVHRGTGESLRWFAESAAEYGLPPGVRVIAVGLGCEALLPEGRSAAGLELLGFVDQPALNALLRRAAAVVVPQRTGFGALTRLPELACAGVPVITCAHPSYAVNPTPGLHIVEPDWDEVCDAMQDAARHPWVIGDHEYECWESEQPQPLGSVVRRVLADR